jgi:DnaK suppressor protein
VVEPEVFKGRLVERRADLEMEIEQGEAAARPVELDPSRVGRLSRMDAMQSQAMSAEAQRRRKIELVRIGSALKRIDDGVFGECVSCGEEIAAARLNHDPSAPTCIECARG